VARTCGTAVGGAVPPRARAAHTADVDPGLCRNPAEPGKVDRRAAKLLSTNSEFCAPVAKYAQCHHRTVARGRFVNREIALRLIWSAPAEPRLVGAATALCMV